MTIEEIMGTGNEPLYEATIEALAANTPESKATYRTLFQQHMSNLRFSAKTEMMASTLTTGQEELNNTTLYEATIDTLAAKTPESQAHLRRLGGQLGNDRRFSARTNKLADRYATARRGATPQP